MGIRDTWSSETSIFSKTALVFSESNFDPSLLEKYVRTVWINGCFDLLHRGHLNTIREAARNGDCLIIGINSDESVRELKGQSRPINSQNERALALAEIPGVKFVIIFSGNTPEGIIQKIKPKVVLKDEFYEQVDYPEKKILEMMDCELIYLKHLAGVSSTAIEKRIQRVTNDGR
jgi:rfaE bifunctional protein nucleotidyltransferase chain/domain